MTRPFRLLSGVNSSSTAYFSPDEATLDSNKFVILTALLCALICILGLIIVARCAWFRRFSTGSSNPANSNASSMRTQQTQPPANKGLKEKTLKSLPKLNFGAEWTSKFTDCAICLAEFVVGDEIRKLPQCSHVFHVSCIDTWLGTNSSCPSCRQILLVARCKKCGGVPGSSSSSNGTEASLKERENNANILIP